jgi:hypothetical protein
MSEPRASGVVHREAVLRATLDGMGWTVIGECEGRLMVAEDRDLPLHSAATWESTPARMLLLKSRVLSHLALFGSHYAMSHGGWRVIEPPRRLTDEEMVDVTQFEPPAGSEERAQAREQRVRDGAARLVAEHQERAARRAPRRG